MKPTKLGQIVKFHSPNLQEGETHEQTYTVVVSITDTYCHIQPNFTNLAIKPITKVRTTDLTLII